MRYSLLITLAFSSLTGVSGFTGEPTQPIHVLQIGDSQSVLKFGETVFDQLSAMPGLIVEQDASWGSSPETWIKGQGTSKFIRRTKAGTVTIPPVGSKINEVPTPALKSILASTHPSITIVELGSNLYGAPDPARVIKTVKEMVNEILAAGSRCVWVGLPDMRERGGPAAVELNKLIRKTVMNQCIYIDSLSITKYPATGGDGIHYDFVGPVGKKLAAEWGSAIVKQIAPIIYGQLKLKPDPNLLVTPLTPQLRSSKGTDGIQKNLAEPGTGSTGGIHSTPAGTLIKN